MVLESILERFFYDLVVTMIFALIAKGVFPRVATAELSVREDLCQAWRSYNAAAKRHGN